MSEYENCGCVSVKDGVNMCKKHSDELNDYYNSRCKHLVPNKGANCETCIISRLIADLAEAKKEIERWIKLTKEIGLKVKCLYSCFPDDNGHIVKAVSELTVALAARDVIIGVKDSALKEIAHGGSESATSHEEWLRCIRTATKAISLSPNEVAEAFTEAREAFQKIVSLGGSAYAISSPNNHSNIAMFALARIDKALKGVSNK